MRMNPIKRFFSANFHQKLGWLELPLLLSVFFSPFLAFAYIAFTLGCVRGLIRPFKLNLSARTQLAGNLAILQFVLAIILYLFGFPIFIPLIISLLCLWYFEYVIVNLILTLEEAEEMAEMMKEAVDNAQ